MPWLLKEKVDLVSDLPHVIVFSSIIFCELWDPRIECSYLNSATAKLNLVHFFKACHWSGYELQAFDLPGKLSDLPINKISCWNFCTTSTTVTDLTLAGAAEA